MKIDRVDALLSLLLLVRGPMSVYRLTSILISAAIVEVPPSGFKSVERSVASRIKKLESLGFVSKDGSEYRVTDRVIIDELHISGVYTGFSEEVGWSLIFNTDNGHYVIFVIDSILEGIPEDGLQKLFSGAPINTPLLNILSGTRR